MNPAPFLRPFQSSVWRSLFIAGVFGLLPLLANAQGDTPPQLPLHVEDRTLLDVLKQGGWIMWPLAGISIACFALILEGFIRIRTSNFAPASVIPKLRAAFAEENYQQAWRICKAHPSFLTNILRRGLERIGRGRIACETALADHSLKESMVYRTKISYLSSIGVVSPMVGLLGTVMGMIKAFQTLGAGGIGDPTKLAAAIGEVLVATASGLAIAIPAFFLYYFLRNRLQLVVVLAEDIINQLMVDVRFEELAGINIGESLEAELAGAAPTPASGRRPSPESPPPQPSSENINACPRCHHPVAPGSPHCEKCGAELQWG